MLGRRQNLVKTIASAEGDSKMVKPDIITITQVINCLDRFEGLMTVERIDEVFEEAAGRGVILSSNSLDTFWEIDLSGMTLPVARAACRHILNRVRNAVNKGEKCEDLILITGVGRAQYPLRTLESIEKKGSFHNQVDYNDNTTDSGSITNSLGVSALREFVQRVLIDDFKPPIYSSIPSKTSGMVRVKKDMLEKWIADEKMHNGDE